MFYVVWAIIIKIFVSFPTLNWSVQSAMSLMCAVSKSIFFSILSRFYDIFKTHARAHENDVDNEKYIIQKIFPPKHDKNYQTHVITIKKHTNRKPFLGHVIVKTSNHSYDKSTIIFFLSYNWFRTIDIRTTHLSYYWWDTVE